MGAMEWVLLGVSVALMVICGIFGAAEYSFVAVDRAAVDRAATSGDRAAIGVRKALRSLSTQLSGAQVGVTITNLVIGFLAEPAIAELLRGPLRSAGVPRGAVTGVAVAVALALATLATMLVGELIPKKIGIAVPLEAAKATQGFMRMFTTVVKPAIHVLNGSANAVVRSVGVEPQEELRSARSSDELASLAGRSASEGTLDEETAHLVQRSVAFGPRTAGEIMTPRMRMAVVDANDPVSEVIELSSTTGFSKFPVIKGSTDTVVGSVHVKQAVAVPRGERVSTHVREVMVPATVVPESLRIDPLLSLMLGGEGFQMAIVSDEYGGTAGVVTLEDVVEEIVGDIADEHDRSAARMRQRPDGSWIVSGLMRPDEVLDATGLALPEHEDYDTVAGLLVQRLGRIPQPGDAVDVALPVEIPEDDDEEPVVEHVQLRVVRMDGLRVDRIAIQRQPGPVEDGPVR